MSAVREPLVSRVAVTPHTSADHLSWPVKQQLDQITAILFEAFAEAMKGRLSEQYRAGRILTLILHGPHSLPDGERAEIGEAFHLLAIVNHPKLARSGRDWLLVRERLRRAWEHGEIAHPVRLTVESLERVNAALADGVPHFVAVVTEGTELYATAGLRLKTPHRLSAPERQARALSQYLRWHKVAGDFLLGAGFYQAQANAPMAALLLHQACEHLYQCVLWTLRLHGPRTHALDELREQAEALDTRLRLVWLRETPFERRAFGCIRRAYIEARYGYDYRISADELAWAMDRAISLHAVVTSICLGAIECPPDSLPASMLEMRHGG